MILSIIAAYAKDADGARVIGKDNGIPWHFPHDLVRFKEYTQGCAIIMGRKTHESIGRVLPKRDNLIVTHQEDYEVEGAHVFNDLEKALAFAASRNSEIFIIGGQQLYEQTLSRAHRLYLTSFKIDDVEGDTFFPDYERRDFKGIHMEKAGISGDCFRILERMGAKEKIFSEDDGVPMPAPTPAPIDLDGETSYNYPGVVYPSGGI